ncbi:ribonuclease E/G [Parasporobacterium paucivorans]|uniref:Ribonuclease G n=1 Tax=Parasporobacterium paucivorans DSM 15970 TaxID=1122934 RepID=A0A1M6A5E1_9FIRM|nr:ribonuclease E/G [Parasporobacterium paucivorans]SHI31722.1 ribonuclease G [Parasporobacterium paucivorans DSM 15970]
MNDRLLVTKFNDCIISAVLNDKGRYLELGCTRENSQSVIGNIYIGKVKNIVKNINAAFIEYENDKIGYLPLEKNLNPMVTLSGNSSRLCIGDELVVQIEKEALKSKEPVITSNIELVGKYAIVTRGATGVAFSKKFTDKTKREDLQKRTDAMELGNFGVIIRTNALYADAQDVISDIRSLVSTFDEIMRTAPYRPAFSRLYSGPEEYISHIRDLNDTNIKKIITDDTEIYDKIKIYLEMFQPSDAGKLEYYKDELLPLYKLYSLEKCLREVQSEKVWLKSGAYIIIQPTEAFVSIDINSGKNIASKKTRDLFLKINIEAAREIAYQIRLRNLSGIIIVDFINMGNPEQEKTLLSEFGAYLEEDRIKTTIVDITKLGLVEMTRKKIRRSINEQLRNEWE